VPIVPRDGPVRQMPVASHTLSLSWSPEYCRGRESRAADARQCAGKSGRFGLVLHGLWPEGAGGGWPQYCPTRRQLSPAEARRNLCMTPSTRLLVHEWQKHGSCMATSPERYFATARRLWGALGIPDLDRLSRRDGLTAGDIRRAIADANPGLRRAGIAVVLNPRGWLTDIRLCYDSRLRPAACDARRLGAADSQAAKIWRGL
jgi:ribonuclease T2